MRLMSSDLFIPLYCILGREAVETNRTEPLIPTPKQRRGYSRCVATAGTDLTANRSRSSEAVPAPKATVSDVLKTSAKASRQ
jgi:hypothetical protein